MPVLDNTCLGWAIDTQVAGLRPAPPSPAAAAALAKAGGGSDGGGAAPAIERLLMAPQEAVVVRMGE